MNPTPNQITECDDERQLREWAAVYCMGWSIVDIQGKPHWDKWTEITPKSKWQPTSPTEKGKAQCWDLAVKYKLDLKFYGNREYPNGAAYCESGEDGFSWYVIRDENIQIAVVKAAILATLNGEEL